MKALITQVFLLLSLVGCATTSEIKTSASTTEAKQISQLQDITWNKVNIDNTVDINAVIDEQTQQLTTATISSPVVGFSVKNSASNINISVTSIVRDLAVFAPTLAVYDQDFKLLKTFDSSLFNYDANNLRIGDVLSGDIQLLLPMTVDSIYIIVYTTAEDVARTTTTLHPAKAYAIARNNVPPAVTDPVAIHSSYGQVYLSFSSKAPFQLFEKTSTVSSPESVSAVYQSPDIAIAYKAQVSEAIANGDIANALAIVEKAEAEGIDGVKETFILLLKK